MRILKKIVNLVAFFLIAFFVYFNFSNISLYANSFFTKVKDDGTLLVSALSGGNYDIKGIGSLIGENDKLFDNGSLGEEYNFDTEFYPYYGMLDLEKQKLYKQIYANAVNLKKTFSPIIKINSEEMSQVIEAVVYDHPELYFLDNNYSFKYNISGICVQVILKFNELANNLENSNRNFKKAVDDIILKASKYKSDLEKEKYVHNYLVNKLVYDENATLNQSAYSALVNKVSVCAGYSRAFQYILMRLNIPCYYVVGESSGNHAWNIVKIDNEYFNVDLTWDNTGDNSYEYFNKSDLEISNTHSRNSLSINLPLCGPSYNDDIYH